AATEDKRMTSQQSASPKRGGGARLTGRVGALRPSGAGARVGATQACLLLGVALLFAATASAQVADLDLRTTVFTEPSPRSEMTVINPSLRLSVTPAEFLSINAGYEADIVSGASEPTKSGQISPDI